MGDTTDREVFTQLSLPQGLSPFGITKLPRGVANQHSCARFHSSVQSLTSGFRCWGANTEGQLGYGDTGMRTSIPSQAVP